VTNTVRIEFEQKKITIDELRKAVREACEEAIIHPPLISEKNNETFGKLR